MEHWYYIEDVHLVDTPALVVYEERVKQNIQALVSMIDDVRRLRPHVKTHKCLEAAGLMMGAGIKKFKCATIAEAEMLALANAPDVLLAYQPSEAKLRRFIKLVLAYPSTIFSCLIDNYETAVLIDVYARSVGICIPVFIDLNVGMNRTGIKPGPGVNQLFDATRQLPGIKVQGFHIYDGHIRDADLAIRTAQCNAVFSAVEQMIATLEPPGEPLDLVAGGSPTFPIHAKRPRVECSPGTFVYWDQGYATLCAEQPFVPAALVIGRIFSQPDEDTLCIDIGHKSVASENDLQNRILFLNAPDLVFKSHSEEHLVAQVKKGQSFKTGDILYGIPDHICPTVALYERALVVTGQRITGEWMTIARDRKITV